jgi:hypothetical protein
MKKFFKVFLLFLNNMLLNFIIFIYFLRKGMVNFYKYGFEARILGRKHLNRCFNGDIVAIEILN